MLMMIITALMVDGDRKGDCGEKIEEMKCEREREWRELMKTLLSSLTRRSRTATQVDYFLPTMPPPEDYFLPPTQRNTI